MFKTIRVFSPVTEKCTGGSFVRAFVVSSSSTIKFLIVSPLVGMMYMPKSWMSINFFSCLYLLIFGLSTAVLGITKLLTISLLQPHIRVPFSCSNHKHSSWSWTHCRKWLETDMRGLLMGNESQNSNILLWEKFNILHTSFWIRNHEVFPMLVVYFCFIYAGRHLCLRLWCNVL